MTRIFADFNALSGGLLSLSFQGSLEDINKQNVQLQRGMRITVYDDEYEAEAIVENIRNEWYARIVKGTGHPI